SVISYQLSVVLLYTKRMLVLGIESSCDETAAAVVRDGREILSSVISSQIDLHRPYGGVVPELASREHLNKIEPIVLAAVKRANIDLKDIDAIAVTQGPGLVGSLLVGVCYAKALAFALEKPFVGVNHIEGHVYSVAFENPPIEYPALALIVSGGHTNLFFIPEEGKYKVVARTRDDAAGEAFDKVAKMLGLSYPGGPVIEKLAREGDAKKIKFTLPKISDGRPDFSFSGLKTAVSKYVRENNIQPVSTENENIAPEIKDLCAGFQHTVVKSLVGTTERLADELNPKTLIVAGGVACNNALREATEQAAQKLRIPVYFPSKHLSTDNAAMIAAAGTFHLKSGRHSALSITADVTMRLQNFEVEDAELRRKKVRYRL
ncbi:MAG TPA: tRNA (adenosine(37)-N6)-threonylcarbamoyltransferase complex transferase subunit TsaD, partial [Pyrinomonadaceae bacterium]|nr:tRNA (adenosine(37)-N6)-threonylcarbamoyltransferase complex transferase subunit TsaD [Pyrinomonadaceae bacterium]